MDANAWDERYASSDLVWGAPPNPVIAAAAWPLPRGRALDLGCGEGRHALWLALHGWQVTAVDFSRVALNKGATVAAKQARRTRERIKWVEADLTTWEVPGEFDLIISAYVHFPAEQRTSLMQRCARALAPGGTLVVLGHDLTNIADGVGGPQEPSVLYTPEDIARDVDGLLEITSATKLDRETANGIAIDAFVSAVRR
jgi:SAM-dependent methyltransferase